LLRLKSSVIYLNYTIDIIRVAPIINQFQNRGVKIGHFRFAYSSAEFFGTPACNFERKIVSVKEVTKIFKQEIRV